jgi:hypothetical protein
LPAATAGQDYRVSWERSVFEVLDDLEQQAEGLALVERDAEVADLSQAEYTQISVSARLHASVGRHLRVRLVGGPVLTGTLARVGEDWVLLVDAGEWIVPVAAIATIDGLSPRARPEETWSVVDRLSLQSVCRRIAAGGDLCTLHFRDDSHLQGHVARVGRDFLEVLVGDGAERRLQVVPLANLAALQGLA